MIEDKSVLLLGPRQTGKSSFVKNQLKEQISLNFNLLDRGQYLRFANDPTLLRQEILQKKALRPLVFIDEIQKLPELLDEIHLMIEDHGMRFILTGSSARKLKRTDVNLLGGRVKYRRVSVNFTRLFIPSWKIPVLIYCERLIMDSSRRFIFRIYQKKT